MSARRNDSNEVLSLSEVQNIELDIMQQLHLFCERENLVYCMAYGTLLGAARHQGFIPWDNDIDIIMPRPDFQQLLRLIKEKEIAHNIDCLHYTNDYTYHYQVIRVCDKRTTVNPEYIREQPSRMGVWVDIFPADGVPSSWKDRPFDQLRLLYYKWVQLADIYAIPMRNIPNKTIKGYISNIIKNLVHFLSPGKNNIHEYKVDQFASVFSYKDYDHVADTIERQKPNWLTHTDFDERILMKFEKYDFYAPKDWAGYLTRYYGNYMQLPPEEKRMTHDIHAQWR